METWRHLRAILMLPFTVTILIPALLVSTAAQLSTHPLLIVIGLLLILAGLTLMVSTIRLFMTAGQGTLSPLDETQRLVVVGIYRYVRNPMITGVISVLLGEAALFGSTAVLIWALIAAVLNAIYIPFVEERGLRQRFGDDYEIYAHYVPRWLPRRTPWSP